MANSVIQFSDVSKIYQKHFWTPKKTVLSHCSFSIEENSITGFVGPNGAGKTTSIKMLLGLSTPTKGSIRINGLAPTDPASRKGVSYLSERPYFYEHLTVNETLLFAARLYGNTGKTIQKDIDHVLESVELVTSKTNRVKDLSKGMQQRLSMAQALLNDPGIFILDEPMSGLDPLGRRLFRQLFAELKQKGKTVFFSTHIIDDVESLCTNVIVLSSGKLTYQGPIRDLVSQGFIGTDLTVDTVSHAILGELQSLGYVLTSLPDGKTVVFVPASKDVVQCQKFLFDHGLFCSSIVRRNASLEDLLYTKAGTYASIV